MNNNNDPIINIYFINNYVNSDQSLMEPCEGGVKSGAICQDSYCVLIRIHVINHTTLCGHCNDIHFVFYTIFMRSFADKSCNISM